MTRVLIIDDEPSIVLAVRDELVFEGFEADSAPDGPAGLRRAAESRPDIVLLDLMLPGVNGFQVCRQLRAALPDIWLIMLTARVQEADRISGFEAGADDYVTKPFSLRELMARIRVGVRRRNGTPRTAMRFADVVVNTAARKVTKAGIEVQLTRKEFDILELLLQRSGEVVNRDDFCDRIWGLDVYVTQRVIDTHIAALRKKIEADPNNPRYIVSVRGVGYKLNDNSEVP